MGKGGGRRGELQQRLKPVSCCESWSLIVRECAAQYVRIAGLEASSTEPWVAGPGFQHTTSSLTSLSHAPGFGDGRGG